MLLWGASSTVCRENRCFTAQTFATYSPPLSVTPSKLLTPLTRFLQCVSSQASTAQPAVFRFLAEQPSVDLYAADSQGNTALHLMVMHKLTRMYDYISELWKSMYEENPARRLGRPPLWTVRNVEGLTPL